MNGINVKICFIKNNKTINVRISELLTLKENLDNVKKLIGEDDDYLEEFPIVYSKYDEIFIDPNELVNKLNIYPNCFLYVA